MADPARRLDHAPHVYAKEIVDDLFRNEDVRQQKLLEQVIEKNTDLGGPPEGFLHAGHFFSTLTGPSRYAATTRKVKGHPDVAEDAAYYLRVKVKRDKDYQKIHQSLGTMVRPCKTFQDLRDAIPEILVPCAAFLNGIQRTRPQGYTVIDRPLVQHQFDLMVDDILYYLANHIIY